MPSEPFWLPVAFIETINVEVVAATGEHHAVRDPGLLESACARPRQLWAYGDPRPGLPELAAALLFGVARNHPFEQGNKRTGFIACVAFLEANGQAVLLDDDERHADLIVDVLEGRASESEMVAVIRQAIADIS